MRGAESEEAVGNYEGVSGSFGENNAAVRFAIVDDVVADGFEPVEFRLSDSGFPVPGVVGEVLKELLR